MRSCWARSLGLRAKRQVLAGALIALAAAIKAFPIAALVYLIYRRYWKASVSLVLTLVFLLLVLPAPFRGGFQRSWNDLAKWGAGMLKYDARGVGQRPGRSQTWKNQSIVGVANRLLRHVDVDSTKPPAQPIYANVADLEFATVNAIIIAVALLLGTIFLAVMPPRRARTPETDAIEFALLFLLMLMLTPLSLFVSFLVAHVSLRRHRATLVYPESDSVVGHRRVRSFSFGHAVSARRAGLRKFFLRRVDPISRTFD